MKKIVAVLLFFFSSLFAANDTREAVSIALKWEHQFQFAGYYAALHKGFYEEEGLDVTLVPRDPAVNHINEVINQTYEYGISDSVLMLYMTRGENVVIVAPIFQQSPNVLMSLKESGIETPYDINGKRLLFYGDDVDGFGVLAMIHGLGVDPVLQRTKPQDDHHALINKEVDIYTGYVSNEPYYLFKEGHEINIIDPANYGVNLYGDMLFTNGVEASEHPERVERVKKATLKGWKYALENPEEIAELIIKHYNSTKTKAHLLYEAQALTQLIRHKSIPLGTLDRGRFIYNIDLYNKHGLISSNVPIDEYIFEAPRTADAASKHKTLLAPHEVDYLEKKGQITVCVDPDWMPFEGLIDGKHAGMTAEYFAMFEASLGVPLHIKQVDTWSQSIEFLKQRKCDVASLLMSTPSRREYLDFTKPYLVTPMVIVTKLEELFISDIKELEGRTVGIVKEYAFKEILSQENPEIILQEVDSARAGMEMVLNGTLDGFIGSLATAGYIIQREYIGQLKIAGKFNKNWSLGVGVRNDEPLLRDIFEKLIDQVPHAQRQEIQNRWQSIVYTVDSKEDIVKWVATVSFVFIVIVLLVLFINRKLRREIKERKVAQQQLHKVSITDELTSLYNRRHFNTVIKNLLAEAKYANESLSFAIMDLDYFKQYNDHYGHQAGDEVLHQIANVLQMSLYRSGDYCFRLGGEEFGILFKGESIQHAKEVFERMQNNIKALNITHEFGTKGNILTASFGVVFAKATLIPTTDMLYKLADDMLYEAKETGRDRICIKEVL